MLFNHIVGSKTITYLYYFITYVISLSCVLNTENRLLNKVDRGKFNDIDNTTRHYKLAKDNVGTDLRIISNGLRRYLHPNKKRIQVMWSLDLAGTAAVSPDLMTLYSKENILLSRYIFNSSLGDPKFNNKSNTIRFLGFRSS